MRVVWMLTKLFKIKSLVLLVKSIADNQFFLLRGCHLDPMIRLLETIFLLCISIWEFCIFIVLNLRWRCFILSLLHNCIQHFHSTQLHFLRPQWELGFNLDFLVILTVKYVFHICYIFINIYYVRNIIFLFKSF